MLLLQAPNREVVKAVLGFLKVVIIVLPPEQLGPHVPDIVDGLLTWPEEHRRRFRDRTKHVFLRLIRKFGYVQRSAWSGSVLLRVRRSCRWIRARAAGPS